VGGSRRAETIHSASYRSSVVRCIAALSRGLLATLNGLNYPRGGNRPSSAKPLTKPGRNKQPPPEFTPDGDHLEWENSRWHISFKAWITKVSRSPPRLTTESGRSPLPSRGGAKDDRVVESTRQRNLPGRSSRKSRLPARGGRADPLEQWVALHRPRREITHRRGHRETARAYALFTSTRKMAARFSVDDRCFVRSWYRALSAEVASRTRRTELSSQSGPPFDRIDLSLAITRSSVRKASASWYFLRGVACDQPRW
jgi:hypothetical protein